MHYWKKLGAGDLLPMFFGNNAPEKVEQKAYAEKRVKKLSSKGADVHDLTAPTRFGGNYYTHAE